MKKIININDIHKQYNIYSETEYNYINRKIILELTKFRNEIFISSMKYYNNIIIDYEIYYHINNSNFWLNIYNKKNYKLDLVGIINGINIYLENFGYLNKYEYEFFLTEDNIISKINKSFRKQKLERICI